MDEAQVRERAEAVCAALVAGDVGQAAEAFSAELRQNLGEVIALLPLPATEGGVESVERGGGSSYTVVLRLVGETEEVLLQSRWKERDDRPTLIELSHLSATEKAIQSGELEPGAEPGDTSDADEAT
jgi:hypothetical protein